MKFKVVLAPSAIKFLDNLQENDFNKMKNALEEISLDPQKGKILTGQLTAFYSWKINKYRIIYEIDKEKRFIYIVKIGIRKKVYR